MANLFIRSALSMVKPYIETAIEKGIEYSNSFPPPPKDYRRVIQAIQDESDPQTFILFIIDMNPVTFDVSTIHYKTKFRITKDTVEKVIDFLSDKV